MTHELSPPRLRRSIVADAQSPTAQSPLSSEAAPSETELAARMHAYERTLDVLRARELSNAEGFDGGILRLSAAALGLSIAVLGRGNASLGAWPRGYLLASWIAFGLAIGMTLLSYLVSQSVLHRTEQRATAYYVHWEEDALRAADPMARRLAIMQYVAAAVFLLGTISTIVFLFLMTGGS